jgi:coatomer subunit beta
LNKKLEAVKNAIQTITNGEQLGPGVLMWIIRFAMPLPDHELKRTLMIFWEILPKKNQDGLLPEMILVW